MRSLWCVLLERCLFCSFFFFFFLSFVFFVFLFVLFVFGSLLTLQIYLFFSHAVRYNLNTKPTLGLQINDVEFTIILKMKKITKLFNPSIKYKQCVNFKLTTMFDAMIWKNRIPILKNTLNTIAG
jgi:hypothetical protein